MKNIILQIGATQLPSYWSVLTPAIAGVVVGITMLVINAYRDGRNQYSNRLKATESKIVEHENRFTQLVVERENLIDKYNARILAVENKLTAVDKLTNEVTRLTTKIDYLTATNEKLESKLESRFEKLLDEIMKMK